ncbi:MAG: hypothetical protein Q8N83_00020, partial [Ignavibacteria bacterium]|nr:hypothetical protein [Ignavibacteria bacterium]
MKRCLLIYFLTISNTLFADFYNINVSEKVINFSSYCTSGKITIFIISEHGCMPCVECKNFMLSKKYDMKKMDVYYCLITKNLDDLRDHKYEKRLSNKMWSYIEGCTMPPYIYIFGPTKNPISIINGFQPEVIESNIKSLIKSLQYYNSNLVENRSGDTDDINNVKAKIKELTIINDKLGNENKQLIEKIDNVQNKTNEFVTSVNKFDSLQNQIKKLL